MNLLIASNNQGKIKEIKEILKGKFENIFSLSDIHLSIDVEEDCDTFFGNSLKKAKEICQLSGYVTIADDSGLVVDALGGAPGVYSARYAGGHCDSTNNQKLLNEMKDIQNRTARFVTSIVLYYPSGDFIHADGEVEGVVLDKLDGEGGFGYDPLFYSVELSKSFGNATKEEKNSISHRARALRKILESLDKI